MKTAGSQQAVALAIVGSGHWDRRFLWNFGASQDYGFLCLYDLDADSAGRVVERDSSLEVIVSLQEMPSDRLIVAEGFRILARGDERLCRRGSRHPRRRALRTSLHMRSAGIDLAMEST